MTENRVGKVTAKSWVWPLPALFAWLLGWAVVLAVIYAGSGPGWALLWGMVPTLWVQSRVQGLVRKAVVVAGLPLSLALTLGLSAVPPWAWLALAALLLGLYPLRAWRDAPLFPTPFSALGGLPSVVQIPPRARILDAGSGLGHGMACLRHAYPDAQIEGVEGSLVWVLVSRLRLRAGAFRSRSDGAVRHGDMWATNWSGFSLIYLFQRPESMARAWRKAQDELKVGSWMVSLEFEVPGQAASRRLICPDGRPLWIYRVAALPDSVPAPLGR